MRLPATKKHYAFRGRLMSLLVLTHYGVSSRPPLPQDKEGFFENHRTQKRRISFSRSLRVFLRSCCIYYHYSSTSTNISIQPLHSQGKWKGVTTGSAITRPTENICGNSTSLKTPQEYPKEGRLKPSFADNVGIPFARARRLRPCPRKASTWSDPGR